jgi:hypothetical protein
MFGLIFEFISIVVLFISVSWYTLGDAMKGGRGKKFLSF